ncbi:MarR family winged helix-turn-helix transcriptional regulator (plasmid) [Rhodococcus antarcticus]|uniref:MarR family winged helix-turn-helix transcriptional regulator n=1 Tax=Rhodococcus antarcticus TaxID=2987751 RepID=A0ABY6P5A2_9NOCA|nr:MarR family winged helix-turn-helix transcriptional regulator [Rhodococcus antarcticus]UZJ26844.1 MarR family winged helix-turn-helix transcriptional regulator [Rhodococcus antarcticus]
MIGPDDVELTGLLGYLQRRLSDRLTRKLAAAGSSLNEWRVLAQLVDGGGSAMRDVATSLDVPASTATKLIDAMVAANLVYRRGDENDGRRVVVHLAPRGRVAYERLSPLLQAEQEELTALTDDGDLEQLTRLLTRLSQKVS